MKGTMIDGKLVVFCNKATLSDTENKLVGEGYRCKRTICWFGKCYKYFGKGTEEIICEIK